MAETGIEVTTHFLNKDSSLARVFGMLHLNKLVALLLHQRWIEIVIAGEVHKEKDPLVPHFIACPPGEHDIAVTLLTIGGGTGFGQTHVYNEAKGRVKVEAGKVTLVHYNFKPGVMAPGAENTEVVTVGSR